MQCDRKLLIRRSDMGCSTVVQISCALQTRKRRARAVHTILQAVLRAARHIHSQILLTGLARWSSRPWYFDEALNDRISPTPVHQAAATQP